MARIVTAGLLVGLVLGSLGHAAEEPETETGPEFTPGIDLVRLGTVGDLPPPDNRLVVDVDAEGRILVAGKPLAYAALKDLVSRRADVSREDGGPAASHLDLVLRIDRSVPWCVAQWLVVLGADPSTLR